MSITKKDQRAMNLAGKLLKCSTHPRYRFSAILTKGGRVISTGINKEGAPKRFTKPHRPNMALHCEIHCILGIPKETTKGATLIVNGETVAGNPINTKPCYTCLMALESAGIKRIVHKDREEIKEIK